MIRLVVANVADKGAAVRQAAQLGDYVMMNECRTNATAAVRVLVKAGWKAFQPKGGARQNTHVWDPERVSSVFHGQRLLVLGGHRGNGKNRKDKRRRGPSRYSTSQVIYDPADRYLVDLTDLHLPAKGSTTARWRMPLVMAALVNARAGAAYRRRRYPGIPQVMAGDGNLPALGAWRMGKSWQIVRTPADFGRRHYTQVYFRGPCHVSLVKVVNTASDHDAVVVDVRLMADAPRFGGQL